MREEVRPNEGRGTVGTVTPRMGDGEMTGGLEAKSERAPAAMAAFSELEGDSAMESMVDT